MAMSMFESLRKKKTPETPEQTFTRNKEKTLDFVLHGDSRPETVEGRIDKGIRTAVEKLNALPFLYTTSIGSCEGHARVYEKTAKFYPGYIHFDIDGSEMSKRFVEELRTIVAEFPLASMSEREDYPPGYNLPGGFRLDLYDQDKNKRNEDTYETRGIYPKDEALHFKAESDRLIKEIENLADRFAHEHTLGV